ncbi:hypothetical protein ABS71_21455 [bacterium SCN 62-11]|nr:response regulator [Candidatus Eremiobacteraeota bacterium]ODT56765.1 MAG: hypothetical protein ABS71_21455 [bacterium SCN 62-11]
MKIYIGEDSPIEQKLLEAVLLGVPDVHFFGDGLSLYRAVFQEPPNLVITDILMPGLQGLALCKLVRGHQRLRSVPILCISSITEGDVAERALAAGADAFLAKPLEVPRFEAIVTELLERSLLT